MFFSDRRSAQFNKQEYFFYLLGFYVVMASCVLMLSIMILLLFCFFHDNELSILILSLKNHLYRPQNLLCYELVFDFPSYLLIALLKATTLHKFIWFNKLKDWGAL